MCAIRARVNGVNDEYTLLYVTSLNCTFSMSAYSSSYAMFVLLYPLYYLYLTNCNTLVRNNNLVSFFANRAFVVAGYEKKNEKKKKEKTIRPRFPNIHPLRIMNPENLFPRMHL